MPIPRHTVLLLHTWLPFPAFSALTAEDLHDASLHAVLGERFDVQIASGKRQIRAVPGDADLLRLLQLKASSPVLLLEGTSFDQDGRPVEVFSTWHHPDHVVFDIDIQRDTEVPSWAGEQGGLASSAADAPDAVADRARQLGAAPTESRASSDPAGRLSACRASRSARVSWHDG
ncbi:GntR family transcriptional regulator [Arthrobacter sp. Ld5]|uniref:GntR family transcriptional regulator n=1 Tax=Arthrobacter sp. Ld5 TaxID=649152 RepID=UPI003EBC0528